MTTLDNKTYYNCFQVDFSPCSIRSDECLFKKSCTTYKPNTEIEKMKLKFCELTGVDEHDIYHFETVMRRDCRIFGELQMPGLYKQLKYCNLCRTMKNKQPNPTVACIPCIEHLHVENVRKTMKVVADTQCKKRKHNPACGSRT